MTDPDTVAAAIADADEVVALTGAGLSTASGIPDFRSEGGLWDEFDEQAFTLRRYRAQPDRFWADWLSLHDHFFDGEVAPNPAHDALARLEETGHLDALLTQNVDGLHGEAGSETVVHLHGTGTSATCPDCGASIAVEAARERVDAGAGAPACDCGGVYKPDTVLFGEQLPRTALQAARRRAETADVFLAAGSSLTVDPAALLPDSALRNGATLVVVNLDRTKYADRADHVAREPVEEFLPAVADRLLDGEHD
ncbi:NAD-dependent protein deacylase [Haloarchaeobius iranensis]|uniref:NAD-dependent deacetylase n=1 Tax=Haloarchaeobius iranensis TaxID=996166 RepID=A0A1G9UF58_9EURY|nr:NAD-dependent protein deacylase [Haloarchaeobius iranensis]SDM58528.1 NAD-dependent deacetylase [Haloarchaeobius iranensis]